MSKGTIATFDKAILKNIVRPALNAKLKELSEELGIEITAGSASYSGANATFKLELATIGDGGVVNTPEREHFLSHSHTFGLPADALDSIVTFSRGEEMRIAGLKIKARKNNILLESIKHPGQFAVAPDETVKALYERAQQQKPG